MERIISASSNEGDVVLDPLWLWHRCACCTEIEARLDRHRHHPPGRKPDRVAHEGCLRREAEVRCDRHTR
ncbi:MAG: hypothetical protein IPG69_16680 [Flavobacteriales bacterium]|nr:hypothetical protein [Flavobacteriales bacterium]